MRYLLLMILASNLFAQSNFAGLSFELPFIHYQFGKGLGEIDQLWLDFGREKNQTKKQKIYIVRTDKSFEIEVDFFKLSWNKPLLAVMAIEELLVKNMQLSLGSKKPSDHDIKVEEVVVKNFAAFDFEASHIHFNCPKSPLKNNFFEQIFNDCLKQGDLTIHRLELISIPPLMKEIIQKNPESSTDISTAKPDLKVKLEENKLTAEMKVKWFFSSRLLLRSKIDHLPQAVQIEIQELKWGIIGVRDIFFKLLKEQVKNPKVTIDPPFIRIEKSAGIFKSNSSK